MEPILKFYIYELLGSVQYKFDGINQNSHNFNPNFFIHSNWKVMFYWLIIIL
jgi:hypothetical protein